MQCHLCGMWLHPAGGSHLLRKHDWTIAEYRRAFKIPKRIPTAERASATTLRLGATVPCCPPIQESYRGLSDEKPSCGWISCGAYALVSRRGNNGSHRAPSKTPSFQSAVIEPVGVLYSNTTKRSSLP